jgi:hypothetical protein
VDCRRADGLGLDSYSAGDLRVSLLFCSASARLELIAGALKSKARLKARGVGARTSRRQE